MLIRILLFLGLTLCALPARAETLAFPGAVGWAKETVGGRGGRMAEARRCFARFRGGNTCRA